MEVDCISVELLYPDMTVTLNTYGLTSAYKTAEDVKPSAVPWHWDTDLTLSQKEPY